MRKRLWWCGEEEAPDEEENNHSEELRVAARRFYGRGRDRGEEEVMDEMGNWGAGRV